VYTIYYVKRKTAVVRIDNTSFTTLLGADTERQGTLELTTLVDNQTRAEIEVYLVEDLDDTGSLDAGKPVLVKKYDVNDLAPMPAGPTRFVLSAAWNGTVLELRLSVDGEPFSADRVKCRRYLGKRRGARIGVLLFLFLLLLLAALLALRRCSTDKITQSPKVRAATEQTRDAESPPKTYLPESEEPDTEETAGRKAPEIVTEDPVGEDASEDIRRDTDSEDIHAQDAPHDVRNVSRTIADVFGSESRTIYFTPESAELTRQGKAELHEILEILTEYPEDSVHITGHTALYGNETGRRALSVERARRAASFLIDGGLNPDQISELEGVAGRFPVSRVREDQHLNRRVEISID
jgi:outer membrane protein OmpA-like peptidoglycan-associated protein